MNERAKKIEEAIAVLASFTPEELDAYLNRLKALVHTPSPWTKAPECAQRKDKSDALM